MKKSMLDTVSIISSCGQDLEPDPGNNDTAIKTGESAILSYGENSTATMTLTFRSDWQLDGQLPEWLDIQPQSGVAGETEITVSALSSNTEITERTASFTIIDGDTGLEYLVIQDGTPGIDTDGADVIVDEDAHEVSVTFTSNTDISPSIPADWFTAAVTVSDSTLLADSVTWSKCRTYTLSLSIEASDGEARQSEVLLAGEDSPDVSATVTVSQTGEFTADFTREFLRRSVFVRYTGTWCVNCPTMNQALHNAAEQYPGHIVQMNLYQNSDDLTFPGLETYFKHFGITVLPTAIVNYYAMVAPHFLDNTAERFISLAEEATGSVPSNTIIGGYASASGDNITVEVSVASKTAGDYYISAFLLEDGIIREQNGGGSGYEHNNVMRAAMTEPFGDPCSLASNSLEHFTLSMPVPASVVNPDNLHVVVFTSHDGRFTGDLADGYIVYRNYGYVVDNAVDIPVGGLRLFDYEN